MKKNFWLSLTVLFLLLIFSWPILDRPDREQNILQNLTSFLSKFLPPDWSVLPDVLKALLESLRMSVLGTMSAVILSLPLSVLASERYSHHLIRRSCLALMTLIRSIPSLVWALLAVSVVGPWPLAGVIALCLYSMGYLIKFFADALDTMDPTASKHLMLEGAHPIQAIQYAMWPQWRPTLLRQSLWMFEYNIRSSSIIGYVGAGGLGSLLHSYQEFYQWNRFSVVLLMILMTVVSLELFARRWGVHLKAKTSA